MSQPTMYWNGEIVEPTYLGLANASERTAPRATVPVDRGALVALLDAWQAFEDTRYSRIEPEGAAYWRQRREIAEETLHEALAAFAEEVRDDA